MNNQWEMTMRELLRLGDLKDQAIDANTVEEVRNALVAVIDHLYHKELDRERSMIGR